MGREIELKIPLSKLEFDELFDKIYTKGGRDFSGIEFYDCNSDLIIKKDEYFSRYDSREERELHKEPQCLRIRTEKDSFGERFYFTLKRKTLENGIEVNREDESFFDNPEVLKEFFAEAGYKKWFVKEKKAYSSHCRLCDYPELDFHVEMVIVNELPYIEVEVTSEDSQPDKIKPLLEMLIQKLGFNPEKKDSRSWLSIIEDFQNGNGKTVIKN